MISEVITKGVLGLGKVSTLYYLSEIQRKHQLTQEEFSTCEMILYQIDFQEINLYLPDQFEKLIPKMANYFNKLSNLNIKKLLIPNITLHETLDQMQLPVEICHPVDLTLNYLKENSIAKIYLFGTLYTMNAGYLKKKFQDFNIEFLILSPEDQTFIDQFRKDVYDEEQTTENISHFQNLIQVYAEKSPVIIACTELSVFSLKNNPHCIDMADLQINSFLI